MANTHTYTKGEEIANAVTHGIGAILSILALVVLIIKAADNGNVLHVVTFSIYGATMLLLYLSSTLLHSFPKGKVKDFFEISDHASIYLFIAGTYTPLLLITIQGALGWALFGIIWGAAILGVLFKVFFVKKFLFTSTFIYIFMGWMIVFAWKPLVANFSFAGTFLLVTGGIVYTLGSAFYVWRSFRFHHAVWHLFVIAGSTIHFFSIMNLLPDNPSL